MTRAETAERDAAIAAAMPMVRWEARSARYLPPNCSPDDLESAGAEALVGAWVSYDPGSGLTFTTHARRGVVRAMNAVVQQARREAKRKRPLDIPTPDGGAIPRPDRRAADPSELAAARDELAVHRPRRSVAQVVAALPTPEAVAEKVRVLRAALFADVTVGDSQQIMAGIVDKARHGDLKAARLFVELLGTGEPAVVVNDKRRVYVTGTVADPGPKRLPAKRDD